MKKSESSNARELTMVVISIQLLSKHSFSQKTLFATNNRFCGLISADNHDFV